MAFERYERIVDFYPRMWPLLVPGYLPLLNAMLDIMRMHSGASRDLLDLGCGPGTATTAIAPACDPAGTVTLVDGSAGMLRAAQALLGRHIARSVHGDFTHADVIRDVFQPARYDIAVVSFALHHLVDTEKRQTIEHVAASLRPGGLVLLCDEVANDRPAGWDVIERIRAHFIQDHLAAGRITQDFWQLEITLPEAQRLPFRPARVEDLTSYMARAGLAVSCPVNIYGSALLLGLKR